MRFFLNGSRLKIAGRIFFGIAAKYFGGGLSVASIIIFRKIGIFFFPGVVFSGIMLYNINESIQ